MTFVLIGEPRVGKTSIRKKYMGKTLATTYLMTLGADFSKKVVQLPDNRKITLNIWDIAGQDVFHPVRSRFLSNSTGVLLVFDLTNKETFLKCANWLNVLWEANPDSKIPLLIIGNKLDLVEDRVVGKYEVAKYIKHLSQYNKPTSIWIQYLETCALTGHNIDLGFEKLAEVIVEIKDHMS
ncbi:MAG: Rab family GTPase [Candidatus Kariarchaeaceae archaeon]